MGRGFGCGCKLRRLRCACARVRQQENESKRNRAVKRTTEERRLRETKENEIRVLSEQLAAKRKEEQDLKREVERNRRYQEYLENVVQYVGKVKFGQRQGRLVVEGSLVICLCVRSRECAMALAGVAFNAVRRTSRRSRTC